MLGSKAVTLIAVAGFVFCLAAAAAAQEQTGSVEGTVRDEQGGVLPGVSVEAHNLAVGARVTVVTDERGEFRYPALGPGYYDVTASLDGFRPGRFERVEVLLGQIKRLEFALGIAPKTLAEKLAGANFSELEEFLADVARRYVLALPSADPKAIVTQRLQHWRRRFRNRN